ncbi:FAD-dependent oxidoreductase [Conexibacter stalactiti]|uniref:ferredoxin--NADP(+) reductase n=1 Tax=Conexibacter stalactiti TaxID=1940611 RepID=A0ABU4HYF9_9ACTN|nr:FAD-dependent oxidoreductase [Conexibacter stalactiti]MDW5598368.1 FAD-dependent oxidoreductase [Conexibacter stalactiti]MEC5039010.1 FAD-dependent oxidoreductase [Conexibacter stalactiti]
MRAAVVGAGPSGFYAAGELSAAGFEVDLYDALPTPFGLVRAGVAPDHPKIKAVTRVYDKIARRPGVRFFGGVEVGRDVTVAELAERYAAVVYAVGTPDANALGIPGEDGPGSHAATEFVGWYNGHPAHTAHDFPLQVERAVVIGNGNVALDVARMLVLEPEELSATDTTDHALAALARAQVREVVVLGRRGPLEAAFTNPELLELGSLARAEPVVAADDLAFDAAAAAAFAAEQADPGSAVPRRIEILREYAALGTRGASHRVVLRFLRTPLAVERDADGAVSGLRVAVNRRVAGTDGGAARFEPTGAEETIPCGLVLRAIGYRGRPLDGLPFVPARGLVANDAGRVAPGTYVTGWVKRGPSGVIGTNKQCANETVARVLEDREAGLLWARADSDAIERWLRERVPAVVSWDGWNAIDLHERAAGEPHGRPRIKLVEVEEMVRRAAS